MNSIESSDKFNERQDKINVSTLVDTAKRISFCSQIRLILVRNVV